MHGRAHGGPSQDRLARIFGNLTEKGNVFFPTPPRAMAEEIGVSMNETTPVLELSGTLNLFGFPPQHAAVGVLPRSRGWRTLRAAGFLGGGLLLAPLVGVVPPHAPWVAGALGFGGFLGIRKWRERFTLVSLEGSCPRCGEVVGIRAGTPLRPTLSVPCDKCHHDSRLRVDLPPAPIGPRSPSGLPSEVGMEEDGEP